MPDRDVVLAKVAMIQRCLKRIKETTDLAPKVNKVPKSNVLRLRISQSLC